MNNIKAATYSRAQKVIEVVGAGKLQSQNSLLYIKNDSGIDISLENIPGSLVTAHLGNSIGSHKFKDSVILNAFRHSPEIVHRPLRSRSPLPYFDPLLVEEYEDEIYNSMHEMEVSNSNQLQTMPVANYIINQPEIEWSMRIQLVSWLVEVHFQFKLLPETLFLAVNLIDRTLSARPISLSKLQLVGVAALLIASKYEEIMSPSVRDLEYITDHAYTQDEILRAERYMLGIVKYQVFLVNPRLVMLTHLIFFAKY